jgi:hypothetical protein
LNQQPLEPRGGGAGTEEPRLSEVCRIEFLPRNPCWKASVVPDGNPRPAPDEFFSPVSTPSCSILVVFLLVLAVTAVAIRDCFHFAGLLGCEARRRFFGQFCELCASTDRIARASRLAWEPPRKGSGHGRSRGCRVAIRASARTGGLRGKWGDGSFDSADFPHS